MKDHIYYVYELIDPRINESFYVGKGKGKRHWSHEREAFSVHQNTEKIRIIEDIKKADLEITYRIVAENLSERDALLLEKLIIFRIGRKIFNEGRLVNIVPGGSWDSDPPLFINDYDIPSESAIRENHPNLYSILEKYPYTSIKYTGLQCPHEPSDENLYVFNRLGERMYSWDIDKFKKVFGLSTAVKMLQSFAASSLPIYGFDRQWKKCDSKHSVDISRVPLEAFDEIEIEFVKELNQAIGKKMSTTIYSNYQDGSCRIKAVLTKGCLDKDFRFYYKSGNLKYRKTFQNGQLNGVSEFFSANGIPEKQTDFCRGMKTEEKTFFENGNLQTLDKFNENNKKVNHKRWYVSGQLSLYTNINQDFESYFESGKLQSKGNYINGMTYVYFEDGNIKYEYRRENTYIVGLEREFYDTGGVKKETDHSDGYKNRIVKTYTRKGEIMKTDTWIDGEKTSIK